MKSHDNYLEYFEDTTDVLNHVNEGSHELTNLSGEPEYEDHEIQLRDVVREWWDRTDGDDEQWAEPVEG